MPDPATVMMAVQSGLQLWQGIKGAFGGGDKVDPALQKLQLEIGQAMLQQMRSESAVTDPFRSGLAGSLGARQGQQLPVESIAIPDITPAFQNIAPQTRTIDPTSFLGKKAELVDRRPRTASASAI